MKSSILFQFDIFDESTLEEYDHLECVEATFVKINPNSVVLRSDKGLETFYDIELVNELIREPNIGDYIEYHILENKKDKAKKIIVDFFYLEPLTQKEILKILEDHGIEYESLLPKTPKKILH